MDRFGYKYSELMEEDEELLRMMLEESAQEVNHS